MTSQLTSQAPIPETLAQPDQPTKPMTAALDVPNYPKDLYDEAWVENDHRDFHTALMAAREVPVNTYKPPPVPEALRKQTELELEAGRAKVAEFEATRAAQRELAAQRKPEPWEGSTVSVFRPEAFDEYKATLKSPAQTVSKDVGLAVPPRK